MNLRLLGRILTAQALSSLGTSVSTIALSYMVLKLTGSVLQMGGVMAISTFPLVVTSFIGGAVLDRYSARNIMVLADLGRAVLIFFMPLLAQVSTGYIYLLAALMGVFSSLFNPGQVKLVGELAEKEHLVKANSYLSVSRDGAELLGYLLGAPLVIALGYTVTFSIDAVSYVLSAILLIGLPRARPATVTEVASGSSAVEAIGAAGSKAALGGGTVRAPRLATLVAEAPHVVNMIWRRPALRTNLLLATFAVTAVMMSIPNSYGLAFEVFDRGAWGLTALEVFTASGMILGGLALSRFSLSGDKNAYVSFGLVAMGVCFIGVSFSPMFWLSIALIGFGGVFNVSTFVPSMILFQEMPKEAYKGRMIAIRAGFGQMGTTG
ncbi:MAG: MFS transporter, partial [Actinobacteria bacterium]|nr:MFS transporter [Actinomycetota bacterium]